MAPATEATQTIEEGLRRRAQIDEMVQELEVHRDGVLEELRRLRTELGAMIEENRPAAAAKNGERVSKARAGERSARGTYGRGSVRRPARPVPPDREPRPLDAVVADYLAQAEHWDAIPVGPCWLQRPDTWSAP